MAPALLSGDVANSCSGAGASLKYLQRSHGVYMSAFPAQRFAGRAGSFCSASMSDGLPELACSAVPALGDHARQVACGLLTTHGTTLPGFEYSAHVERYSGGLPVMRPA